MLITWNEDLRTGDDQIDHQHMYLIEQTNRLYDLVADGTAQDECERIISKLLKYVKRHFTAEEELMEELSYPDVATHVRDHQEFSNKVQEFYDRYKNGEVITPATIQYLLAGFFENHIRKYDLALAHFAKKSKVRQLGLTE